MESSRIRGNEVGAGRTERGIPEYRRIFHEKYIRRGRELCEG